jgi:uncharacterized protein (TIGR02118 family)
MARLVVIYKRPKDIAAFDKYYSETHIPIAKKIPGLRKYEISQGPILSPMGLSDSQLIATLHFDDLQSIERALASPEGQAAAGDLRNFAPNAGDVSMFIFESREV